MRGTPKLPLRQLPSSDKAMTQTVPSDFRRRWAYTYMFQHSSSRREILFTYLFLRITPPARVKCTIYLNFSLRLGPVLSILLTPKGQGARRGLPVPGVNDEVPSKALHGFQ